MTARVMLALDPDEQPDRDWAGELLAWDLGYLWGQRSQARCAAMIWIVASCWPDVVEHGPSRWPTLAELTGHLEGWAARSVSHSDTTSLLTVAVAAGWLRYADVTEAAQ